MSETPSPSSVTIVTDYEPIPEVVRAVGSGRPEKYHLADLGINQHVVITNPTKRIRQTLATRARNLGIHISVRTLVDENGNKIVKCWRVAPPATAAEPAAATESAENTETVQ